MMDYYDSLRHSLHSHCKASTPMSQELANEMAAILAPFIIVEMCVMGAFSMRYDCDYYHTFISIEDKFLVVWLTEKHLKRRCPELFTTLLDKEDGICTKKFDLTDPASIEEAALWIIQVVRKCSKPT